MCYNTFNNSLIWNEISFNYEKFIIFIIILNILKYIFFAVEFGSYDYSTAFQCMSLKVDECKLYCKNQDADEAECEDPWPPTDSLSCYCYKQDKLIDGKVLHLK